jgi:heme exporter protein D
MMQAAYISYAVFLALLLLFALVVASIIGVRSLLDYFRRRRQNNIRTGGPPGN